MKLNNFLITTATGLFLVQAGCSYQSSNKGNSQQSENKNAAYKTGEPASIGNDNERTLGSRPPINASKPGGPRNKATPRP